MARLILHITTAPEWEAARARRRIPRAEPRDRGLHPLLDARRRWCTWATGSTGTCPTSCSCASTRARSTSELRVGGIERRRSPASSRTCTGRSPVDAVRAVVPWKRGDDGFELPIEVHAWRVIAMQILRPERSAGDSGGRRSSNGRELAWLEVGEAELEVRFFEAAVDLEQLAGDEAAGAATRGRARSTRCPRAGPSRLSGVRRTISSWISWLSSTISSALVAIEPTAIAFDAHLRREVGGHEPRHVRERGLGGAVRDEAAVAQPADRGRDVDDRARPRSRACAARPPCSARTRS